MKNSIENKIREAGIVPTPVRILVARCLEQAESPLSLTDLETLLESVDKSTISRTLSAFRKCHLVHSFNDGSGSVKYEICRSPESFGDDMHVHFRCEVCGKTECLNSLKIPLVEVPEGYSVLSVNYVISGICNTCASKNKSL